MHCFLTFSVFCVPILKIFLCLYPHQLKRENMPIPPTFNIIFSDFLIQVDFLIDNVYSSQQGAVKSDHCIVPPKPPLGSVSQTTKAHIIDNHIMQTLNKCRLVNRLGYSQTMHF